MKHSSKTFSVMLCGLIVTSLYADSFEQKPAANLSSLEHSPLIASTIFKHKKSEAKSLAPTKEEPVDLGTRFMNYAALDNGYRWDKLSNRATLGGRTIPVAGSTQLIRKIQSYQLGGKAQWSYYNAFIRGSGHYGWVFDGKYSEGGFFGNAKGNTWDVEGALGYYFTLTRGVWLAPLAGWSHDAFLLKGDHIHTAINGEVFYLNDIKVHQEFNGPFIGFDFVYQFNDRADFVFGYEWHYAHWHGTRIIQGHEYGNPPFGATTGFSNTRHLDNVWGQVFKLDSTYRFLDNWMIGLGLKYQFFNGDFGKYKRTKTPLIPQYDYAKVDGLWWRSFGATIYLGGMF